MLEPTHVWVLSLNTYHQRNLTRLAEHLEAIGSFKVTVISRPELDSMNSCFKSTFRSMPSAVIVMNDWAGASRTLVEWANKYACPTYAVVEGVNDFNDVDTQRKRNAYRRVGNVFLNGDFDRKYFSDFNGKVYVGGIDRLDELYDRMHSLPAFVMRRRAVINCNFTYGVLAKNSINWIHQVVESCAATGLEYVISKHPADKTPVYPYTLSHRLLADELIESEVFITRFSGAVFEALVAGCKVIYFNPDIEKIDKFSEPLGAFLYARSRSELEKCLEVVQSGWEPTVAEFLKLHADFTYDQRDASDLAINKVAKVLVRDLKKNPWRLSWNRMLARFRERGALKDLHNRLELLKKNQMRINSTVDDLENARLLFNQGRYASSCVCYSQLNERSSSSIYDANISLAAKRISQSQVPTLSSVLELAGVEQIYVVNLDRRTDRKLRMSLEFARVGVVPHFISAIDANDPFIDDLYDAHLKYSEPRVGFDAHLTEQHRQSIQRVLSKAAVAYKLTKKSIFEDAFSKGYRRIAVFDDDVFFSDFVVKRLGCFVEAQPDDWKIVALGASDYSFAQHLSYVDVISDMDSKGFYTPVPGKTCGSFAMLYDHSVYEELIRGCEYPSGTYDNTVLGALYAKYPDQSFVLFPNVVTPCVEESDIRDSRNQLAQSQRMFWDLSNYKRWSANLNVFVVCDDLCLAESALANLADTHALTIQFVALDQARSQISKTDLSAQTTIGALQAPNKLYELIFAELAKVRSSIDPKRFFLFLIDAGAV